MNTTTVLTYTEKQMNKIHVTKNFVDKRITLEEAMEILQCSERTIYRYQDLYKTE